MVEDLIVEELRMLRVVSAMLVRITNEIGHVVPSFYELSSKGSGRKIMASFTVSHRYKNIRTPCRR